MECMQRWLWHCNPETGEIGSGISIMACNGWVTTLVYLENMLSAQIIVHIHKNTVTHIHIYCPCTDAHFLPPTLSCTHTLANLVGDHCLSPLIDCLPGITFQTINTIKNPLKPLKPQRTSNHLTIKTHRKKKNCLTSQSTQALFVSSNHIVMIFKHIFLLLMQLI